MEIKDAALRVMQEVYLFTDRPDYVMPKSVREAFSVLNEAFGIDGRTYPEEED